jgi:protein ImuA
MMTLGKERPARPGLAALRARIGRLERGRRAARVLPLGAPALDARLPGGGLALGALHEVEGARVEWDDGVAAGFCLALVAPLAAALDGPVLWVARRPDLHGGGLAALGLDPARFVFVRAEGDREVLWAMEEGLRCAALGAVVGEVAEMAPTAGRRLQLAAEASGVTAVLLRRRFAPPRGKEPPGAASTRWRVAPLASGPAPLEGLPGRPRWRVELRRCRGAAPGAFLVEWDDASGDIALAAALRDGSPGPRPAAGAAARLAG